MPYEPHPYPEPRFWRVAPPVTAAALAAVGFAAMFAVPAGPARTVVLVAVLIAQVALMAGRGVVLRRSARMVDGPVYWHQFFFAWSFFTSGIHLLGSDDSSSLTAAINVGSGLFFAVLLTSGFLAMNRVPKRRPRRDTEGR